MMGLDEIKAANAKASEVVSERETSEVVSERETAADLFFAITILERIAGAVNVEFARNLAAGAIESIARSRGVSGDDSGEPIADAA